MNNSATSPPIWTVEAPLESWRQGESDPTKRTIRCKYIEMFKHFEQVFEQLPNNDKQEGGDILHSERMAGRMNMV